MNKIYKVIWSHVKQCYVVTSELAKAHGRTSTRGRTSRLAVAALTAFILTAGVTSVGLANTVTDNNGNTITNTDTKITDINANITGKENKVTDSSNAEIVGDKNTVTNKAVGEDGSVRYVRSNDARIHGSGNTISASRNQQVIGDNNTIMGRDDGTVTDYQHPEGREPNVSDLTIGRGNFIRSTDTYRNEWDSLKVIGNNNRADFKIESAGGPAAGIVIGDNQNIDGIKDSIVIGSLSPDEQKEQVGEDGYKSDKYFVGSNSIVVGYHATSSKDASTVIGNRSKVSGNYQTVTGLRSTIEGNYYNSLNLLDGQSGNFASIYGSFNKIEDATGEDDMDGVGNSINGSMNVTSNARGTMIMGVGNTVTHSKGEFLFPKDDDSSISTGDLLYVGAFTASDYAQGRDITGDNLTYPADQVYAYMRDAWQRYMETSGGAVSVLGNSNTSDYAIRSQILGTNNMLKGAEGNISSYNTISGFSNTGTNVKRTAIVGTGNNLTNGVDNVVIGDYHTLENGKHNVILGSMASEEQAVTKTAKAAWAATDDNPDGTYTYTVNEQVALKPNTKDIENAVMVGYNTDATVDGGVALGSDSIASTEAGKTGYDAKGKKHAKSDNDYAAWVATDAAVSVGGADREVTYDVLDKDGKPVKDDNGKTKQETQIVKSTRQITNLAAGMQDTDAVNVAQLKSARTHFYSVNSEDATAGNYNNNGATGINALAAGVGARAEADHSIAIGTNAWANEGDGRAKGSGDIAIGNHSKTGNYVNQSGSIAIGQNAETANMAGNQEAIFAFGQTKYSGTILSSNRLPDDASKVPTAIAIGQNSYARTGGLMIGTHNYNGKLGDVTVNSNDTNDVNAKSKNVFTTTLGTNSYNVGAFSTITGAYSIASGSYKGGRSSSDAGKNFGATITGSLNSIESATATGYSGIANSIVGTANRTFNSNGSLIFGAGNEITNSVTSISVPTVNGGDSAQALQQTLMKAVHDSKSGGATLVIGGGNKADYTQKTQIIGVNNKVTGTEGTTADFNLIDGYENTATHVKHATVIGSGNTVSGEEKDNVEGLILLGDNRNVWKQADHSVVIGSSDDTGHSYVTRPDTVVIGHNAYIEDHGGNTSGGGDIAIGHNSFVENYVNQSGSIAFGENTHVRNSVGSTENAFVLGQYETTQDPAGTTIPTDVAKMNASIAIGENTFARTGSLMVGTHKYTGEIGDTTVDTSDATSMAQANQQINETVLGTNSFSLGAFSTVTGAYSIISGDYDKGKWRNFGSSITGSLNSIESKTATTADAGNASHIIGTANRMQNANGAVVIGSGNEITDSYAAMRMPTSNNTSAKDLSEKIRESIKANGGGAAAIVGNGNEVKKSTNVAVMGSKNSVTSTTNSQIFGDNRVITGADGAPIDGAVIIGSADATTPLTTDKQNVTILGYNANATVEGGVALGAGSVASMDKASTDANAIGYDPITQKASTDTSSTWKSTAAAVSVGDASKKITRQITNVAAGTQDTDAVNVAQLKAISNTVNASKTKYYSVQNMPFTADQLGTYAKYTNEANDGAKKMGALAAGYMTYAGGIASTVTGSLSGVINRVPSSGEWDFRGATALSYGTFNINNNTDHSGAFSGVANSIVGQANMTTDSNAALIYGAGNVISNSYRDIDISKMGAITSNLKDPIALGEALQAAVPTSGGQVMAFGGGNVVDNAYMTQVIGVGNTVKGNQKKNNDGTWSSDGNTGFNDDTSSHSQLNYVDGFYTTLINGKNDIGANNTVTGDSVENNHSNIVIGDNHTLENQSNNIILGSAASALPTTASQVTILGHNANATVDGGVALGYGSIANREAGKAGLDLSLVNKDGKVGDFSKDTNPVWTSNAAAVSIGNIVKDSEGKLTADAITRQITGVAAGSEDYDAVNVAQLRQVVAKMNYYTVKESDKVTVPPSMKDLTNKDNDGAKKDYGMAAGYMTNTNGVASTVSGSFSGITTATATTDAEKENVKYQGAAALSYGTFNYNRNTDASQKSAGAVNSLVGQTNLVENSNAAQIYGSANSITNSYRHINMDEINSILNDGNPETSTPDKVMEKLQKAIVDEKTGGMVTVVGSANTADKAYMTQIQGVSNTVRGSVVIDENNEKNATTHNYVGGFFNTLENGKSNYVIGTKNTITSSSDSTKNASNIVIGDNHKLTNGSHNVIIGSEDVETAKETPAARHGLRMMAAEETETSNSPDNVVRIGHNAKATYDYGAALGAGSVASTDAGVYGYDPLTGIASTSEDKTWKSTWAAASIGDSTHTRQLTNVGWADTDAVNVAQLRAVASKVGSVMNLVAGDGISIVNKDGVYTISANIKGGSTPTDDVKVDPEKPGEGGNTSGSTTDTPVTPVDPGNTGNTENPGNTDNPSNGSGLIITAETKPTHFGADSGEATAVKPGETLAIKGDTTNIMTTASDHGITVSLKKDIAVDSITAGDTKMTSDGLTITGGPSITKSGIDAGGKKVTHVADGEIAADSKDAVNGSQLYRVQKNVESIENNVTNLAGDVTNLNGRVSDLDNRVNKVGAGAAALAALHPLDFNPDDKWNFAVGYGNYRNANSVAVGAFYQPNENTMFNVATNFGNGENMINAGVSFKIGKGNSYAGISKAQLVAENQQLKENDALQDQKIQKQDQEIQELKKALEELKSRIK